MTQDRSSDEQGTPLDEETANETAGTPENEGEVEPPIDLQDEKAAEEEKESEGARGDEGKEPASEAAAMREKWLRALAEVENIRNRAEREQKDARRYAIADFARDLLDVSDNLQRALKSIDRSSELGENARSLLDGVEMTERTLMQIFEKYGIEVIDPDGEKFDPQHHQAMFEVEADAPAGTVVQVVQRGFRIHDRLLRPAMVGVAAKSSQSGDDGGERKTGS